MHRISGIMMLALLSALVCTGATAGNYNLDWGVVAGGGDTGTPEGNYNLDWGVVAGGGDTGTSASYRLTVTPGQPAAGFGQGASQLHWIGFLTGEMTVPTVAPSAYAAKLMPDGTFVSIAGRIATSAIGDFAGFFYIEEPTRASGIRIAAPPSAVAGLSRTSVVNVIGTLSSTADDERQISGPIVIIVSTHDPLAPLSMANAWVGGGDVPRTPPVGQYGVYRWVIAWDSIKLKWAPVWGPSPDLNNIGLLIQTWGKVTEVGMGYVVMDDGSGPVRVDTTTLASPPSMGDYVSVIGISSLSKGICDHSRLVLPRWDGVTIW